MSWIDRANQWALSMIRGQKVAAVLADRDGVKFTIAGALRLLPWSEVEEIAALAQPALATGSFTLAIRGPGTTLTLVDGTAKGFSELCDELPRRLDGVVPYPQWSLELLAAPEESGKVIFRRGT
jgi:hypothetical protein